MSGAFDVEIYDKAFARRGWVGAYESCKVTMRHNALSTAEIVVASDHVRIADLVADGARVVIRRDGAVLMSGPIWTRAGDVAPGGSVTLGVESDWRILTEILGWPVPGAGIAAQGTGGAYAGYDMAVGSAETVVKHFVSVNASRLGLPVTVAPDLGRGGTARVYARMHPLADRLYPLVDLRGVGVTVVQSGAGLLVDCYAPTVRTRPLTVESGILVGGPWQADGPAATRVIVGGAGQDINREFIQVIDTAAETAWGRKVEAFVDARDVAAGATAELTQRGTDALLAAQATTSMALKLAETPAFQYGQAYLEGDVFTVAPLPGLSYTRVLREVELLDTDKDGLVIEPRVGDAASAGPDQFLVRAVSRLAANVRDLRAGR